MASHKALGRGINALFGTAGEAKTASAPKQEPFGDHNAVRELKVNSIKPNRHQPRVDFDEASIDELAQSIQNHGLAQPIVVTETQVQGQYELVMGERRLRASKKAGLETIPCIIKSMTNRERFELALIENIQREDLNAIEEAQALDGLMKEFNLTQDQVAEAIGKSRSAVANALRYLRLHEDVQAALRQGTISEGHAKVLAGLTDHAEQLRLLKKISDEQLTVRELETLLTAKKQQQPKKGSSGKSKSSLELAEIKRYEEELQRILGRRVDIQSTGKKGWMRFAFYSPWDLDNLCKRLGLLIKDSEEKPAE